MSVVMEVAPAQRAEESSAKLGPSKRPSLPRRRRTSPWPSIRLTLIAVALATLARYLLHPYIGQHAPYTVFILAVVLVSWRTGLWPGLTAAAMGGVAGTFLFTSTHDGQRLSLPQISISLGLYFGTCLTIALICERLLTSRSRLQRSAENALQQQRRLEAEMGARHEAEQVARIASDTTTRVLNSVADSIVALDFDWRVTLANQNALGLLGATQMELIGSRLSSEQLRALGESVESHLRTVRATRVASRFEAFAPAPGRWFEYRVYPTPEGVTFFALDITDERQAREALEESEERYRMFLTQSSEAIWRFELERPVSVALPADEQIEHFYRHAYLAECNDAMARQYGYDSAAQIIGKRLAEFLPRDDEASLAYLRLFLRSGYRLSDAESVELDREGNKRVFINNLLGIVENGTLLRAWGTQRDVTERVKAEDEIRKLNIELEHRVEERTQELKLANQELEAFCYSVSHDLRGPVRAVMASSMMLLEDYDQKLDDDGKRLLNRLVAGAKNMGQLIDDLLELSRLQRVDVQKQRLNLAKIAEEVAQEISARGMCPKEVKIVIEPEMPAEADPGLTRVALMNLVENACKFSARAPQPRVEIGRREVNGELVFFVRDNGIGFNPQYADKIFNPFERLHRPDEFPGTGIGLANVRRVVERHGGKVWAEGEEGKGATFFFTL